MKTRIWIGCLLVGAIGFSLCGCATKETQVEAVAVVTDNTSAEETPEPTAEPTPEITPEATPEATSEPTEEPQEMRILGQKEGTALATCLIENATGMDIKGLRIRKEGEEDFAEDLLKGSDPIKAGEICRLQIDQATDPEAEENTEEASSAEEANAVIDVQITYADDVTQELHVFPFGKTEQVRLLRTEAYSYLEYEDKESGETVNTAAQEEALRNEAEPAEPEAAVQQDVPVTDTTYVAPQQTYVQPTYTEPAATPAADPNEGCLTDDALTYDDAPAQEPAATPAAETPATPAAEPATPAAEPAAPAPEQPAAQEPAPAPADPGEPMIVGPPGSDPNEGCLGSDALTYD